MQLGEFHRQDVQVALAAVMVNLLVASVAWTYRAYWLLQIERVVDVVQGQAARRKKNSFLSGNFGPVDKEVQVSDLVVTGQLPKALNGVFARTGPNPALPINGDYHWFDGDGMIHAVRVKDGKASYANRYVHTNKLETERKFGHSLYLKFGDMHGFGGLWHAGLAELRRKVGVTPRGEGEGTANTALVYHAKQLLALHEGDLPYALRMACNGIVDTIGRVSFGGKVAHPFTAHPKVDPVTGEMFYIGYQMDAKPPKYWYGGVDPEGVHQFEVMVELKEGVMMHDMAITQDYAIILDTPLVFKPEVMLTQGRLPLVFDKTRPARFGVLPKRPKSGKEIRWFELPPVMIFHVVNAWQETPDLIKMFACCFKEFEMDPRKADPRITDEGAQRVCELTFNLATGEATSRQIADVVCDFPRVPLSLVGHKSRYAYAAWTKHGGLAGAFAGVVKLDLAAKSGDDAEIGRVEHGPECWGGEAVFVPKHSSTAAGGEEDDGYLVTYVHNEASGESSMVVYDAKTMAAEPVARVVLPQRVPYGFHGEWMSEEQFASQAPAAA